MVDREMMLVLILGDSLSLPRPGEGVRYVDTWPYQLERLGRDEFMIVNLSEGGATISTLRKKLAAYLGYYQPDHVILQSGIVDCTPRVLRNWERYVVFRFPFFRSQVRNFLKNNHAPISNARNIVGTSIVRFERELEKIKKMLPASAGLTVLPIAKAGPALISSSPKVEININSYNDVLCGFCADHEAALMRLPPFELLPDGHHLTRGDHVVLAQDIYMQLRSDGRKSVS